MSVGAVLAWMVAIAFASLFVLGAVSASGGDDVVSWWASWAMGGRLGGGLSGDQVFTQVLVNIMLSAGMWQLMAAVPIFRLSKMVYGRPARMVYGRIMGAAGALVLLNPVGLLSGSQWPFVLNLDALTWFPALVLIGCALDNQLFTRRSAGTLSAPPTGR
ncbi:hypothetical protein SAMN05443377_10132 [Propionibacterium cyclohexanicum]|uniref:Uncharacterized protein n=2 Tax=Propionibacterium cyclohexanicum TaxID=64702 RepID=A0A1H9PGZ2_9ACTN|nr:hypothetical protein SAMN05443377_10132 [Propionibacterium cyclohexanicum]